MKKTDFNEEVGNTLNFNLKYLGVLHIEERRRKAIKKKLNGFNIKRS